MVSSPWYTLSDCLLDQKFLQKCMEQNKDLLIIHVQELFIYREVKQV